MVDLGDQHGCGRLSDRAQHGEPVNFLSVWKMAGLVHECRFPIRFDLFDLIADKLVVLKHAFNIPAKEWRQVAPISRLDISEALLQTLSDPLAAQMDPMKREQTLDPTDDARALLDQVLTLAFDTFSILFLNGRNPHVTRHFSVARKPCPQCACHSFSIEAIGLCPSPLTRHEKARGI